MYGNFNKFRGLRKGSIVRIWGFLIMILTKSFLPSFLGFRYSNLMVLERNFIVFLIRLSPLIDNHQIKSN